MIADVEYADLPISVPEQDQFGIDPFVQALARSIREMKTPNGVVIALNGPWGSGKSSAINLLKHHLREGAEAGYLEIVNFNPWWFRGEEALILAFFRELYATTKQSLTAKAKKALPKLGARLLKAGGIITPAADMLGAGGVGSIASGAMEWLGGLIEDDDSVEKLHAELAAALAGQNKRFVVLIDDIDRLSPDEALSVFRLVKSAGRLPSIIYVLAFDRLLAEKIVAERFPSEGPHYLEKIVQASFEIPLPNEASLHQHLLSKIFEISGTPEEGSLVHVMNLFHEVVAPEIHTPRDAVRFVNAFSITWPAVAGDVDLGDFLALEAYRLFRPTIYQAIRMNRPLLCGVSVSGLGQPSITHEQLDAQLIPSVADTARFRRGLMRLFPKLESIWSNVFHGGGERWAKQRRACVAEHFPTYFQLSLSDDVIPRREVETFLDHADDPAWISEALRAAAKTKRQDGGTRVAPLLDALTIHASEVPLKKIGALLSGVFAVVDDIDTEADQAKGFSIGNNVLRTHWLIRALLLERTDLKARSKILMSAMKSASLGWLVDLACSAWGDYHPREGKERKDEAKCLVTEIDAKQLKKAALKAIKHAARDGGLITHRDLASLLYRWRDLAADEGRAARRWTSARLKEDDAVAHLAAAFTSHSWSQGMGFNGLGDLVARRNDRAQVTSLHTIMDRDRFRRRIEQLAKELAKGSSESAIVRRFLDAWKAQELNPD